MILHNQFSCVQPSSQGRVLASRWLWVNVPNLMRDNLFVDRHIHRRQLNN